MQSSRRLQRAIALALLPIAAATVNAQTSVLEEVVVTAQKREQNIQDVGITMNAMSGEQLQALGVRTSDELAVFTPGVHISGALAGQNSQYAIRGVVQNDFNDIIEAPNAVYLDEGYIPIANAQTFGLFDIERVEVLKGPQGTLFGRNATGGLVQYISRKPTFDAVEGFIDLSGGVYDSPENPWSQRIEGAIGGPLGDRVAARIAGFYTNTDDYLINTYPAGAPAPGFGSGAGSPGEGAGADMGSNETHAFRGTVDFQPNDDVLLRLSGNYAKSTVSTGPYQSIPTIAVLDEQGEIIDVRHIARDETRLSIQGDGDGGGNVIDGSVFLPGGGLGLPGRPVPGGDFFGYIDPDGDGWRTSGDFAFEDQGETEATGIQGRLEWDLAGGAQLVAITDWKNYQKALFIDVDSAPVNQLANFGAVDADSLSQEIRLTGETDRTRWVAGVYYLNIDTDSDNGLKAPVNSIIFDLFGAPFDIGVKAALETTSYSGFGQVEFDMTDTLTFTLGARVIQEEKDYEMLANGFFISTGPDSTNEGEPLPDVPVPGAPFSFQDDSDDTLWAGKVQLDWRPQDGHLVYASLSRGVKAGSYNAPLLGSYLGSGGDASLKYEPEELTAYEIGFKSSLTDRTRLNGAAYFYDYKDSQAFLFVGVGGIVINADAENYGAELQLQTTPFDGFDLSLGVAYIDATTKDVPLRAGSPLPPRDVEPTYTPELQASAMARYSWSALGGLMSVRADASYSDEYYYNLRNFSADKYDSYVLMNLGLGWATEDNAWQVSLDARNVTDEKAGLQGYDLASLCGCNEVSYRPPRWYGLSLRRSF
jgi:iron complex outermembrane receptor protein